MGKGASGNIQASFCSFCFPLTKLSQTKFSASALFDGETTAVQIAAHSLETTTSSHEGGERNHLTETEIQADLLLWSLFFNKRISKDIHLPLLLEWVISSSQDGDHYMASLMTSGLFWLFTTTKETKNSTTFLTNIMHLSSNVKTKIILWKFS